VNVNRRSLRFGRDDKVGVWRWGKVCDGDRSSILLCPCGYVTSVHEVWVAGIPGLKSETWGTLRVSLDSGWCVQMARLLTVTERARPLRA
jgi:hypothetical protein